MRKGGLGFPERKGLYIATMTVSMKGLMSIFFELLSLLECRGPVCYDRFLVALTAGVPVTVFYRFERSKLALAWREWMTKRVLEVRWKALLSVVPVSSRPVCSFQKKCCPVPFRLSAHI